jgi:hypothetical protein
MSKGTSKSEPSLMELICGVMEMVMNSVSSSIKPRASNEALPVENPMRSSKPLNTVRSDRRSAKDSSHSTSGSSKMRMLMGVASGQASKLDNTPLRCT